MKFQVMMIVTLMLAGCVSYNAPEGMKVEDTQQAAVADTAQITVRITNLRNEEGVVGISLFDRAEVFPGEWSEAVENTAVEIVGGQVEYVFEDVSPGIYAVSVLHDENENGAFDSSLLGMPEEGYGASRNPDARYAAPDFEEAKFEVAAGQEISFDIELIYW